MVVRISRCRICGNDDLVEIIDLGKQYLTGVFPSDTDPTLITRGSLQLVKCNGPETVCGLVQLRHSYPAKQMYGSGYGYRSGLNQSMVAHLNTKVKKIEKMVVLSSEDVVIDIGSNDGTTLQQYKLGPHLIGIDPTAEKFQKYYPSESLIINDFFSTKVAMRATNGKLAKVITSFAMMYDIENPIAFANDVAEVLSKNGIWVFEQSYLPSMVERLAYDTICHEHLEYYCLRQIKWILDKVHLKIIDLEFNDVNGGSFSVTAAHKSSVYTSPQDLISYALDQEQKKGYTEMDIYKDFADRVITSKIELVREISKLVTGGKRIIGLGASTKGNVLLQFCNFNTQVIESIGDVNPDKYQCFTPGTWIPITSEEEALASKADYFLVLPWHFKSFFMENERFIGKKLIFPLPKYEIITR